MAFRHLLVDVTDGTEEPVIALLDWQQYDDSVLFSDITPLGKQAQTSNTGKTGDPYAFQYSHQ